MGVDGSFASSGEGFRVGLVGLAGSGEGLILTVSNILVVLSLYVNPLPLDLEGFKFMSECVVQTFGYNIIYSSKSFNKDMYKI